MTLNPRLLANFLDLDRMTAAWRANCRFPHVLRRTALSALHMATFLLLRSTSNMPGPLVVLCGRKLRSSSTRTLSVLRACLLSDRGRCGYISAGSWCTPSSPDGCLFPTAFSVFRLQVVLNRIQVICLG